MATLSADLCMEVLSIDPAVAFAYHQPAATVFASDISAEAARPASCNVAHPGLQQRVQSPQGDLFEAFEDESFCAAVGPMTCNPPYISSNKIGHLPDEVVWHEPRLAFDAGPLGINLLQRLIRQAPRFLRPGGRLAFEMGLGQGAAIVRGLRNSNALSTVRTFNDHKDEITAVLACESHAPHIDRNGDCHVGAGER